MSKYIDSLRELYLPHADSAAAKPMKAYMRNQFEYLGIKTPLQRELQRRFIAEVGLPVLSDLPDVLLELWDLPEREYQYVGIHILGKMDEKLPPEFIDTIETLLTTKSWWDTGDTLASHTVGSHFRRFPQVKEQALSKWRKSGDIWLRRTCLLFQLNDKDETDFDLLCDIIRENLGQKEFFINKATGWALRTYSRVDAERVRTFVTEAPLHPLSAKEAMKWLERQESKAG